MQLYPAPLARVVNELMKMPTVGPKTAQRLAFYLLQTSREEVDRLVAALGEMKEKMIFCSRCFNISDREPCRICEDASRDQGTICVVGDPRDIVALEKSREYHGLYHVLGGTISPIDGIGPDELRIRELLDRLKRGNIRELMLATDPDVEGEATALYLSKLIKPLGIKVTRLAHGLPMGSDLEYADEVTLARAIEGRRTL